MIEFLGGLLVVALMLPYLLLSSALALPVLFYSLMISIIFNITLVIKAKRRNS